MKKKKLALIANISISLVTLGLASAADAALSSRLGGLAYYDDVLDITWLADANYAQTSGYDADGTMTWDDANIWVASLNINGITGWRLPTMIDTGTSGCTWSTTGGTDCGFNVQTGSAATTVYSEIASLWTDTLGNLPSYDTNGDLQRGRGLTNMGPFSNIQPIRYWYGLEYAPATSVAWYFSANTGQQYRTGKSNDILASWAVRSGDVSAVPVPAAMWLFGSGLLALIGAARRKKI